MDVVQWIVAGTALYGAVLATINHLSTKRASRPRVVVRTTTGFPVCGADIGEPSIMVEAANNGHVPVVASSFGLRLPNGDSVWLGHSWTLTGLPAPVLPGRSHMVAEPMKALALSLAHHGHTGRLRLIGFCKTEVGDEHRSKPFTFDVDDWLRSVA